MDYKNLNVWKESLDMVEEVYHLAAAFPKSELYALSDQIKRAAVSVPSNIAEGANRNTDKEFIQFLYIALGSASEVETQLILAQRLGYANSIEKQLNHLIIIRKMINALIKSLKNKKATL